MNRKDILVLKRHGGGVRPGDGMGMASVTVIKAALTLCLFCGLVVAQVPKVAVYVSENAGYSESEGSTLNTAAQSALVNSGRYVVVERSSAIDEELKKQAGGSVDDDQLTAFGRQAGAQFICVTDKIYIGRNSLTVGGRNGEFDKVLHDEYVVSARMIDVETAELVGFGAVNANIAGTGDLAKAVTSSVREMLETVRLQRTNLPGRAVYVQGGYEYKRLIPLVYTYTLAVLFYRSRSGASNADFRVVERSEAFTKQIDREQAEQRRGHVDDRQIARLGKQYGIDRIVLVKIAPGVNNSSSVSASLVNVESAVVEKMSPVIETEKVVARGPAGFEFLLGRLLKTDDELRGEAEKAEVRKKEFEKQRVETEKKEKKHGVIWGIITIIGIGALIALFAVSD